MNRKVLECLVKCGAFDAVDAMRSRVFATIEHQMKRAASVQRDRERGRPRSSMLSTVNARQKTTGQSTAVEWSQGEMLALKELPRVLRDWPSFESTRRRFCDATN